MKDLWHYRVLRELLFPSPHICIMKTLIWFFQGDQSTRNLNYSPSDFFSMFHQGHLIFITFNECITLQKCKNKNCSTLPLCNVESFWECKCNVFILTSSVFSSHFIFWLKCDEDLRHREYHVARTSWVWGRVWLVRGGVAWGVCGWSHTCPPRQLASRRYTSCWNADLLTVSSDRHTPLTYQQNLRVDRLYGSFSSCSLHIELVMWISAKPINVFCG